MANGDVTTNDVMEFLEKNMVMRGEFDKLSGRVEHIESRVEHIESRVDHIENQMVTKDYLDNKLTELGAEIGKRISKQAKLEEDFRKTLIDILASKSILQGADIERLKDFI